MTVQDGICRPDAESTILHVIDCRPLDSHRMQIDFNDGTTKDVDISPLFGLPVFKTLENASVFRDFKIDHGVLTWLDGDIDIAPEWLYEQGISKV